MNLQNNDKSFFNELGFTLIELMIVVAIIGILASVAIPGFLNYIRKSRTTEAHHVLRKIYDGQVAYYHADHVSQDGTRVDSQFVNASLNPATVPGVNRVHADWSSPEWQALNISVDSPVFFQYESPTTGTGINSNFTARAIGDLDGDGIKSIFERNCSVTSDGEVVGGAGMYKIRELE